MHALILQHSEHETPGTLLDWLASAGHKATVHHSYSSPAFPIPASFDSLIVLGGIMNVDDEGEHPWLVSEKKFIADWLATDKPTLGICLGGQLLAQALGGSVKRSADREIGFQLVTKTGSHPALERWPASLPVYQYHEDFFTLPPGCQSLATSPVCAHQAFSRGAHLLALQFHPESTASWIGKNGPTIEKRPGETYVQTPEETAALTPTLLPPLTACFFRLLSDFFPA